jgi:hypothetical protein
MSRLIHATELLKHGKAYFSNLKTKSNHTSLNSIINICDVFYLWVLLLCLIHSISHIDVMVDFW